MVHSYQPSDNSPPAIAIVGMATVFPGANDTDQLWQLLENGRNTVSEIPKQRFDTSRYPQNSQRAIQTSVGNFISDPDVFDHSFFHISPREARTMDPQQRLLLRVAYDALENAGYVPGDTPSFIPKTFGVYIGAATNDYVHNLRNNIDVYYSTGTLQAFLSGKIAYTFGFGGPCMTLDTACSSSMVAIHQACRALQVNECNAALAGGVNIITSPDMYLGLARGHFLSPTAAQCRPWDAAADGYTRAEGCGLFVLKRLPDALAEGDRVLGIVRATVVAQAGAARSITHPHGPALAELFRAAVRAAGVHPHAISAVECHGTGTQAGDVVEMEALRAVFGRGRDSEQKAGQDKTRACLDPSPLHVTAVKGNLGHAEAASGAASVAKVLLMMQHRMIPRHATFERLNPKLGDLRVDGVRIDTENVPWPRDAGGTRLALVSNFGAAGSIAAMVLEEFAAEPRERGTRRRGDTRTGFVVGLSARSVEAAQQRREAYVARLEGGAVQDDQEDEAGGDDDEREGMEKMSLADFAYTATARRQLHRYRIAASGRCKDEILASLLAARVVEVPTSEKGHARDNEDSEQVVFVFSGQGSQYIGMGAELYVKIPLVKRIVDECDSKLMGWGYAGVVDVFRGAQSDEADEQSSDRDRGYEALWTALFVLEYALAKLLISWGIMPAALVGHSFGEYAALVVAGVLTLEDGLKLVALRARLITQKCVKGRTSMSSVRSSAERLAPIFDNHPGVEVCCYNSASHCTVGGPIEKLDQFDAFCATKGIRSMRLDVPYAYHSATMDPILDELRDVGATIQLSAPTIPVLSNVTGAILKTDRETLLGSDYFARHCREPARFDQAVNDLRTYLDLSTKVAAYVELGPHPSTVPLLRDIQTNGVPLLLSTLRKKTSDFETLCSVLAQLYCTAVPVEWRKVFADLAPGARPVDLPAYPFSTSSRFWVPYEEELPQKMAPPSLVQRTRYALLDRCISLASDGDAACSSGRVVFETEMTTVVTLIRGHRVAGVGICPASVYAELALSAAACAFERDAMGRTKEDMLYLTEVVFPKAAVHTPGREMMARFRIEVDVFNPPGQKHAGSFEITLLEDGAGDSADGGLGSGRADKAMPCCLGFFGRTNVGALSSKLAYAQATVEREIRRLTDAVGGGKMSPSAQPEMFSARTIYGKLFPLIVDYAEEYWAIKTAVVDASSSSVYAVVQVPPSNSKMHRGEYLLVAPPVFVDAVLHVAGFLVNFTLGMNGRDAYICSRVDKAKFVYPGLDVEARYGVYAAVTYTEKTEVAVDVYVVTLDDPQGRIVGCIKRARFRKMALASLKRALSAASASSSEMPGGGEKSTPFGPATTTCQGSLPVNPSICGNNSVIPSTSSGLRLNSMRTRQTPSRAIENDVVQIISELSGIPVGEITRDAELPQLGIDSLMIWELVARLRALFDAHDVSTNAFSQAATVGDLLRIVSDGSSAGGEPALSDTSTFDSLATLCVDSDGPSMFDGESLPRRGVAQVLVLDGRPLHTQRTVLARTDTSRRAVTAMGVKDILSALLDVPACDITDEAELGSLGLDSLTMLEARQAFFTDFGLRIEAEDLTNCRTVMELVKLVLSLLHSPAVADRNHSHTSNLSLGAVSGTAPELIKLQIAPAHLVDVVPPLILVHDGTGFVGPYARLSSLERDVWAIQNTSYQTCDILRDARPEERVYTMAATYAKLVAETCFPSGNGYRRECVLGGWSFGGVVAYAMSRRLESRGIRVLGMVLIDAPSPDSKDLLLDEAIVAVSGRLVSTDHPAGMTHRTREHVQAQMGYATRALFGYDHRRGGALGEGSGETLRAVLLRSREPVHTSLGQDVDFPVYLTREGDAALIEGWEEAVGEHVEVLEIPGDHFTAFSPENIIEVSKQLEKGLHILCHGSSHGPELYRML